MELASLLKVWMHEPTILVEAQPSSGLEPMRKEFALTDGWC
jgi:hypothetical protein